MKLARLPHRVLCPFDRKEGGGVQIEYFSFGLAVQPVKLFLIPQDFTHFFLLIYLCI